AILAGRRGSGAQKVETALCQRGSITQTASAYGRIRPVRQVKISPDVSGEITDIYFEEGDTVKRGDLLLKIKQESYLMAIARCKAALGTALKARDAQVCEARLRELEYERMNALYESDASCLAQLQQAQIAFETASARAGECEYRVAAEEASLAAARSELRKTLLYSPMDGVVSSLRVKPGERVVGTSTMAGTEMMTIADLDSMEIVVNIGESDIISVREGEEAQIKPDAAPGIALKGYVSKIAGCSVGESQMGSNTDFEVRISIEPQDVIRLLPGMSASVLIVTGSKNDILTVPLQSVVVRDGRETVWVVDGDGRVKPVAVTCGIQDFGRVEICGGLSEGDRVVTGPFQTINKTLKEGDKVKTQL
ncbi:MAG: efflux RND transporter periplasmic adaptor subunit, partial [Bacteroidales bacterium]|nr:efflux RND transporter periplasmic adaptor subunit [Bacteroidales bacterium]